MDEDCERSFETLQTRLQEAPILAYSQSEGQYILDTDASGVGIGAVLSQEQQGTERVIAYASRTLSRQERNYCVTRRELLAVLYFPRHFKQYLYENSLIVRFMVPFAG